MAITQTALSADLSDRALKMTVASGTGFPTSGATTPQSYLVRIDNEYMYAMLQPSAGIITLRSRGANGTAAVAHDTLAKVSVSSDPQDFVGPSPGNNVELPPAAPIQATLGEDKTFTAAEVAAWGNQPRVLAITKASACLFTLAAPSKAQDGLTLVITSLTAHAHIMTATGLLGDGASGSPEDTATWDAFIGASLTLQAQNGIWNVISATAVPIT